MPIIRATFRAYPGHSRTVFLTEDDLEFASPRGITLEIEEISYEIDNLSLVKAKRLEIARMAKELVDMQCEKRLNGSFFEISAKLSRARAELQQEISTISKQLEIDSLRRGLNAKEREIASLEHDLKALERDIEAHKPTNVASLEHDRKPSRKQNLYHALVEQFEKAGRHLKVKKLEHSRVETELSQGLQQGMSLERDAQVLNPDFIPKKDWIEKSQKAWDLHDDGLITSRLKFEKSALSIHICGSFGKGYGAILRSQCIPIFGSSRPLSFKDGVSTFYTRLHGVALGVEIALRYKLTRCTFYVPSLNLYNLLTRIWDPNGSEKYDLLRDDLKSVLRQEDKADFENIYRLTLKILSCLHKLRVHGICFFRWQPKLSAYITKPLSSLLTEAVTKI